MIRMKPTAQSVTHLCKAKVRGELKIVADILPVYDVDLHGHSATVADLEVVAVGAVHLIEGEGMLATLWYIIKVASHRGAP